MLPPTSDLTRPKPVPSLPVREDQEDEDEYNESR
jgi:hypothetical protein